MFVILSQGIPVASGVSYRQVVDAAGKYPESKVLYVPELTPSADYERALAYAAYCREQGHYPFHMKDIERGVEEGNSFQALVEVMGSWRGNWGSSVVWSMPTGRKGESVTITFSEKAE